MMYDEHDERPELVTKRARVIMLERVGTYIIVVALVVLLIFDIANAFMEAEQRSVLIDCTTPGGECFKEGQERTAAAIQQLIDDNLLQEVATRRVVVLAAQCANQPGVQTVDQIEACVERGLK